MASFAPETIIQIGSFPVTNTIINTILVDAVLIGFAIFIKNNISKIPGKIQNLTEMIFKSMYEMTVGIAGKNSAKIFPFFMTFFLFILISNWTGLLPGVGSIGFNSHKEYVKEETEKNETKNHDDSKKAETDNHDQKSKESSKKEESHDKEEESHLIPLLRGNTSDVNTTFALAIISLFATHFLAIKTLGFGEYLSKYFSINPIMLFVGILEIVSEFTKVISLSFRLFGNIYAGEVVLHTISSLFAFLAPLPFMMLEVIVGLVQALVFSMLTMVFMSVLMTPHHSEH